MKRGFTLIELLIVIAIIAILALIAVPNFIEAQVRAKVSRVHADMRSVATGMESYFVDHNHYPVFFWGASPGNPQGEFRIYAGPLRSCAGLTTPIRYTGAGLSEVMDPLNELQPKEWDRTYWVNNIQDGAMHQIAFGTTNWNKLGAAIPASVTAPAPLMFNGDESRIYPSVWTISSLGPDRCVNDLNLSSGARAHPHYLMRDPTMWGYFTQGESCFYDPTNGTVSWGNIWRFSGGSSSE